VGVGRYQERCLAVKSEKMRRQISQSSSRKEYRNQREYLQCGKIWCQQHRPLLNRFQRNDATVPMAVLVSDPSAERDDTITVCGEVASSSPHTRIKSSWYSHQVDSGGMTCARNVYRVSLRIDCRWWSRVGPRLVFGSYHHHRPDGHYSTYRRVADVRYNWWLYHVSDPDFDQPYDPISPVSCPRGIASISK
jgi:hypothetical protein